MKAKILVIVSSLMIAILLMGGGYGFWEKRIIIRGDLEVAVPAAIVNPEQDTSDNLFLQIPEGITGQSNPAQAGIPTNGAGDVPDEITAEDPVPNIDSENLTGTEDTENTETSGRGDAADSQDTNAGNETDNSTNAGENTLDNNTENSTGSEDAENTKPSGRRDAADSEDTDAGNETDNSTNAGENTVDSNNTEN